MQRLCGFWVCLQVVSETHLFRPPAVARGSLSKIQGQRLSWEAGASQVAATPMTRGHCSLFSSFKIDPTWLVTKKPKHKTETNSIKTLNMVHVKNILKKKKWPDSQFPSLILYHLTRWLFFPHPCKTNKKARNQKQKQKHWSFLCGKGKSTGSLDWRQRTVGGLSEYTLSGGADSCPLLHSGSQC